MIVLGGDVSSKSTGLALVRREELLEQAVWTPPKKATRSAELLEYYVEFSNWLTVAEDNWGQIDLAVVEELSVTRGWKTVRALSHFEAITYLALEQHSIPLRTIKPGAARNWVLGLPITSEKAVVLAEVRRRWPDLRLPPSNQGGGDVADAYVMGLAGPEALRRQR